MVEQFVEAADQYNVELWAGGLDALGALSDDEGCDGGPRRLRENRRDASEAALGTAV